MAKPQQQYKPSQYKIVQIKEFLYAHVDDFIFLCEFKSFMQQIKCKIAFKRPRRLCAQKITSKSNQHQGDRLLVKRSKDRLCVSRLESSFGLQNVSHVHPSSSLSFADAATEFLNF